MICCTAVNAIKYAYTVKLHRRLVFSSCILRFISGTAYIVDIAELRINYAKEYIHVEYKRCTSMHIHEDRHTARGDSYRALV